MATPARLAIRGVALSEALVRLAERSRVPIAFSPSLLPPDRLVDCDCATRNLARTLDALLARSDLGYVEQGSQVVIVPRTPREALPADATPGGRAGAEVVAATPKPPSDMESGRGTDDSPAYHDAAARRLIEGARAARDSLSSEIESYTAIVRERMSGEAGILVREWPVFSRESVTRVRWAKDEPSVMRVLGSRLTVGGQRFKPRTAEGVASRFATDPLRDPFSLLVASASGVNGRTSWFVPSVTPLDPDAERFYRFRSGDTVSVRFAGGSVRAVSVTAQPRARHLGLVFAVMWIEPETFGVVRTIYRPAKPIDSELDLRHVSGFPLSFETMIVGTPLGDLEGPSPPRPGLWSRIWSYASRFSGARQEWHVPVAVVDYGLWNLRHWLPRRASFAHFWRMGDQWEESVRMWANSYHDWDFEIEEVSTGGGDQPISALSTEERVRSWRERGDTVRVEDASETDPGAMVIVPRDWRTLAMSDHLPPSIWEERESGLHGRLMEEAGEVLDSIEFARRPRNPRADEIDRDISPWRYEPPILTPELMRYNPIEGLSVGTRLTRRFPWGQGALTVRSATRRSKPDIHVAAEYGRTGPRVRLSLYRGIRRGGTRALAHLGTAWGWAGSTTIDTTWSDNTRGAAIQVLPAKSDPLGPSFGVFSETNTTLGGDARRRHGVDLSWSPWWGGLTGRRLSGGSEVLLRGVVGDHPNVRLSVTGRLVVPLPLGLSTALEAGGGRIWGDPAPEEIWRLGSSGDWLRGYPGTVLRGRRVSRSRIELGRKVSLFTPSVFHDWAKVDDGSLRSAGVGVAVFGGFLRVDLARPLSPWSAEGPRAQIPRELGWQWHLRAFAPF